jgi:hypothetical protein
MSVEGTEGIAYGAIAAWLLNKLWDHFSGSHKEVLSETKTLTIAMVELRSEIRSLKETIAEIPALRKDINSIGSKVREMQLINKEKERL